MTEAPAAARPTGTPAAPAAAPESGRSTDSLSALAAAILSATGGAPSGDLGALRAAPAPATPTLPSGPTGLGTSTLRLIPRLAETLPPTESEADGTGDPVLFCPGPLRDDPALGEVVNEGVVAWAEEVGIYVGALDKLRGYDFGRLIMLAHPGTNDPDRLLAATKCVVVEWATDDYLIDEVELGADPALVGNRLATLHCVVDPARLPAKYAPSLDGYRHDEPIAGAFRSAMTHLARYTTPAQLGRFQHQMSILFVAWNQEAEWHRNGYTPAVWEYLVQRHLNSYLPPMVLIDPVAGYELQASEYFHPLVRRAFTTAGLANVLLNDIYSGAQESATDYNLPAVLVAEEGLSRREALVRTVEIHNELMHAFVDDALVLSATGSPPLQRFLADTWAWLGGSREWHATTARYHARPTDTDRPGEQER